MIYTLTDKVKPDRVTVMQWSMMGRNGSNQGPASAGAAFGLKVFSGKDVPEKLYGYCGLNAPYPYTYESQYYSGFLVNDKMSGERFALPNNANQSNFTGTDALAADAKTNKVGDWDFVANGGNGKFISSSTTSVASGSNGSIFGDGFTSIGNHPSSCGGPGDSTARGPLATGDKITGWSLISSVLKKYIIEVSPTASDGWTNGEGGTGKFKLSVNASGFITLANGVPVSTLSGDVFTCKGGTTPQEASQTPTQESIIVAFIEYF